MIMVVGNQAKASAIAVKVAKNLADIPVIAQNVYNWQQWLSNDDGL